ncbi:putative major capsid protein [Bacillus phage phiAGATE]|uniref:Major capsid protein n=1 Tax=Bacillus phage phiAGATE TaxID=1204533 RepID=L0LBZ8_9CAUD|nr:major head protein [Bacillus phage phiAGATE]AGB62606.1 putative major capsid protein [Bacillus phage phiAGATE]
MSESKFQKGQVSLPKEAEDFLLKTFTTGYAINSEDQHDAAALRYELLDDEVHVLTWGNDDFTIYPMLNKSQVTSTVYQYPIFNQHGRTGSSRFVREVGVAPINSPSLRQKTVQMKFLSDTKQQSLAAGLVRNVADPMTFLTQDAVSVLAKTIEWATFYGDASLSNDPTNDQAGLEFDGLHKLIDQKTNVLDLRGEGLTEQVLNKAAVVVGKGYGIATDAFMPIGVQADFTNSLLDRQRALMPSGAGGMSTGFAVTEFMSSRGNIRLHGSTIMENDNVLIENRMPEQNAPLPAQAVAATVKTNAKGKFNKDKENVLSYKVVVNAESAESPSSEAVAATITNNTDAVELKITLQPMYQAAPQFVTIYRQGAETGHYFQIARVPYSKVNESNQIVFTDTNEVIPETTDVFIGEMSPNVISLLQLLPMMKLPLAQMNATNTFTVLWYGALALYAPKKWVRIKNVRYIPALAAETSITQ